MVSAACSVTPQETEGPYYFDERLVTTARRDGNGYLALMTFDVQQA